MALASGETNVPIGDWTTGTLKIYHDEKMELLNLRAIDKVDYERQVSNERDQRYHERWAAQEEATKNLKDYQNEFRGSLNDLSTKMATKNELTAAIRALSEKIEAQEKVNTEFRSRLDIGNPAIGSIQQQLATSAGVQKGSDITMGKIYAAIGAVGVILGMLVLLANNVFK